MGGVRPIRILLALAVGIPFLLSLIAVAVKGPIVVRPPSRKFAVEISPQRLRQDVETLCTDFSPRDYRHPENLERAAAWIGERLAEAGLEVEAQEYELLEGRFRNVIGRRDGNDPTTGAVVVGAHYDAYGEFAAADDNASGVAVLLELARSLRNVTPRTTLYLVAFGTEEPPFFGSESMGSHFFASRLRHQGVQVDLMAALDSVGYFSELPGSQRFPVRGMGLLYPDTGNFITVVGDLRAGAWIKRVKLGLMASAGDLPVHSFRAPASFAGVDNSDHLSFRRLEMPGVLITDTAYMRSPHYHSRTDLPDTLDYERMALVVRGLHGLLRED